MSRRGEPGRRATLLALGGSLAAYLLVSAQPWVTGTADDVVLGATPLSGSAAELAPAGTALAFVVGAGGVALATGGRRIRYAASVAIVLAALGMVIVAIGVVTDPAGELGGRAAELVGRAGAVVPVRAQLAPAAWVGLVAGVSVLASSMWAAWTARRWVGLSSRFDRDGPNSAGGMGTRRSVWDDLTEGIDHTWRDDQTST